MSENVLIKDYNKKNRQCIGPTAVHKISVGPRTMNYKINYDRQDLSQAGPYVRQEKMQLVKKIDSLFCYCAHTHKKKLTKVFSTSNVITGQ